MQVYGGMGYIEETGVAQYYRDVRITAIYEGTNGIQAMDLVGRKLADGGAAAPRAGRGEMDGDRPPAAGEPRRRASPPPGSRLDAATGWMAAAEPDDRFAGATPYLRAFALTLGGHYLLRAALADAPAARALAAFHIRQLLPDVPPSAKPPARGRPRSKAARHEGRRGDQLPLRPPAPGEAVELAEGVLWLRIPLPFRPDHVNVYALDDGDGWTVIDSRARHPADPRGLEGAPRRPAAAASRCAG